MVIYKEIESICRVGNNKKIHAPKRQSMKKSKMRCVYKRDSIMFYFDGEKEKASKILMNKENFWNKCQLERINNRAEGCYLYMKCCDFEFCFLSAVNYRDMPSWRICQYSYKRTAHLKLRLRRFQAVENENVPEKVYDIIKRDLRKRKIRWDGWLVG